MTSAVRVSADFDHTDVPSIVRGAAKLGLLESVAVLLFSLVSRRLEGPLELTLEAAIVVLGLVAVIVLPGLWTRARTIEGIAGAAAIGLFAAVVYLLVDVILLQRIGTYTFRWRAIGGGSNWWYHPVWWMVGTYLPWLGAWILALQTAKTGAPSVGALLGLTLIGTILAAALAVLIGVPGASWTLPTFSIAVLPGLALALLASVPGSRRA
jgi:hypothetical protein